MAKRKASRKHEVSLDGARAALRRFDLRAPIGTYYIDALFVDNDALARRARQLVYDTVWMALSRERHRTEFPKAMQAADAFFGALDVARKAMEGFDPDEIASVLALAEPIDTCGRRLEPSAEIEKIIDHTEDIKLAIGWSIDAYRAAVWRPDFINEEKGNATIRFDHYPIECIARSWRELYGRKINRNAGDLKQITALVGATMRDFDYPAPPASKLSDRIRHHRVWK
jgi:hypothetical protein